MARQPRYGRVKQYKNYGFVQDDYVARTVGTPTATQQVFHSVGLARQVERLGIQPMRFRNPSAVHGACNVFCMQWASIVLHGTDPAAERQAELVQKVPQVLSFQKFMAAQYDADGNPLAEPAISLQLMYGQLGLRSRNASESYPCKQFSELVSNDRGPDHPAYVVNLPLDDSHHSVAAVRFPASFLYFDPVEGEFEVPRQAASDFFSSAWSRFIASQCEVTAYGVLSRGIPVLMGR